MGLALLGGLISVFGTKMCAKGVHDSMHDRALSGLNRQTPNMEFSRPKAGAYPGLNDAHLPGSLWRKEVPGTSRSGALGVTRLGQSSSA